MIRTRSRPGFEQRERLNLPFAVLLDPDNKVSQLYGVDAIPTLFVIDKDGKVIHGHVGYEIDFEFLLARELKLTNYSFDAGENNR
jgi:hypothetical protein